METTAINLGQMLAAGTLPPVSADAQPGFAAVMELIQSGAPPGLPPPPEKEMKAGAAILKQNAGTQELDLFPIEAERAQTVNAGLMLGFGPTFGFQASEAPNNARPLGIQPKPALEQMPEIRFAGQPPSTPKTAWTLTAVQGEPLPAATLPPVKALVDQPRQGERAAESRTPSSRSGPQQELKSTPFVSPEQEKALQISSVETAPKAGGSVITRADLISRVISQGPENVWPKPAARTGDASASERVPLGLKRTEAAAPIIAKLPAEAPEVVVPGSRDVAPIKGGAQIAQPVEAEEAAPLILTEPESKTPEGATLRQQPVIEATDEPQQAATLPRAQLREVVKQVTERIEHLAAMRSTETVTVKLEPFELGTITLSIRSSEGNIETRIAASNDQVRQALELNGAQLSRALEGKGLTLSQMSVAHQAASQSQADAQARQPAQHRPPSPGHNPAQEISIEAMRQMSRKATGVDLWI